MNVTAILMKSTDNVATVLEEVCAGDVVKVRLDQETYDYKVEENIPNGHKFALQCIAKGTWVRKYGQIIGVASEEIYPGRHVHIHNVESCRGRGDQS